MILLIGETKGHLGASLALRELLGREEGPPPPVDLATERTHGDFVRGLIAEGKITACHDLSDGGLLIGLAEMTLPKTIGAKIELPVPANQPATIFAYLLGEDQARYLMTAAPAQLSEIEKRAAAQNIPLTTLGITQRTVFEIEGICTLEVAQMRAAHERWLAEFMA